MKFWGTSYFHIPIAVYDIISSSCHPTISLTIGQTKQWQNGGL